MHTLILTDAELYQLFADLRLLECLNYNPDARHPSDNYSPASLVMLHQKLGSESK